MMKSLSAAAAAALLISAAESQTGTPAQAQEQATFFYADLADLALAAPVAAHVRVRRAVPLKPGEGGAVPAGFTRYYVEADVLSLIRGSGGMPSRIGYLADVRTAPGGKPPKLAKKSEHIVLGSTVAGRPAELRLVAPDAQIAFTPDRAATVRAILREASERSAPPRIIGIGRAFHAPGSLPGESETQIFLQTADGGPVSLSVLRRPGEQPRWSLALGEMVDEAAATPKPQTLLWYRLACALPRSLPAASLANAEEAHHAAIQADYRLVLAELGACTRARR